MGVARTFHRSRERGVATQVDTSVLAAYREQTAQQFLLDIVPNTVVASFREGDAGAPIAVLCGFPLCFAAVSARG